MCIVCEHIRMLETQIAAVTEIFSNCSCVCYCTFVRTYSNCRYVHMCVRTYPYTYVNGVSLICT